MKKALMFILIMLIATVFLTSCNFNSNTNGDDDDPKIDDSWTVITNANTLEVYKTLLASAMGSLEAMSDKKVNSTNPILSIDAKVSVELNDHLLWFEFKLNYDDNSPENILFSAEVIYDDTDSVLLGVYYKDNIFYISVSDGEAGKLKINVDDDMLNKLLPITFENFDVTQVAVILNSVLEINGNITGRTRMNGTLSEYEYCLNIDLPTTLKLIVGTINEDLIENLDKDKISLIIERIMGVSFEDILNENLPECTLEINFSTLGNKLQTFGVDLNVDQDQSTRNTLFGGEMINLKLDLEKLKINSAFTSIPFFAETDLLNEFPSYINQGFRVLLNVKQKGQTASQDIDYLLKSELKFDLDNVENNQLSFEVLDEQNNQNIKAGIYVYDNMFYLYQYDDESEEYVKKIEFEFDIADIYDKIKEGVEIQLPGDEEDEEEEDEYISANRALEYVAYFVGAIRITGEKLSFTINEDFYSLVFPGFVNLILYADEVLEEDLQQMFEDAEINFIEYFMNNTFEIYINLSEDADSFITTIDEIVFPDGVDGRLEQEDDDDPEEEGDPEEQ